MEKRVTTFDRLDRIIKFLEDQVLQAVSMGVVDPREINLPVVTYVEAQIHGPIDFSRDIERVVIARSELRGVGSEVLGNIQAFLDTHDVDLFYLEDDMETLTGPFNRV